MIVIVSRLLNSKWAAPVIAGAALLLYLFTQGLVYDYDSLFYARQIEQRGDIVHPYHLFGHPLIWLSWQVLQFFNPEIRVIAAGGFFSALCMALAIGLLFHLVKRTTSSAWLALGTSLVWAGSYAGWHYGTQMEVVALALLAMLAALRVSFRVLWEETSIKTRWLAAILSSLLPFIHLSLVVYLPMLFLLQIWHRHQKKWLVTFLPPTLCMMVSAVLMLFIVPLLNFSSGWDVFAGQYGGRSLADIPVTLQTWLSVISYSFSPESSLPDYIWIIAAVVVGIWLATIIILWLFDMRPARPQAFLLFIGTGCALLFFTWWEPESTDFAVIPFLLILLCAVLTPSVAAFRQMRLITCFLGVSLPMLNLPVIIYATDPLNDPFREITLKAKVEIKPEDVVLVDPEMIELEFKYLNGFENINVIMSYDDMPTEWLEDYLWGNVLATTEPGQSVWVQGDVLDANPVLFILQGDEAQQVAMEKTLANLSVFCVPGFSTTNREGREIMFYRFVPPNEGMKRWYEESLRKDRLQEEMPEGMLAE